jgi:hypothetical protein
LIEVKNYKNLGHTSFFFYYYSSLLSSSLINLKNNIITIEDSLDLWNLGLDGSWKGCLTQVGWVWHGASLSPLGLAARLAQGIGVRRQDPMLMGSTSYPKLIGSTYRPKALGSAWGPKALGFDIRTQG